MEKEIKFLKQLNNFKTKNFKESIQEHRQNLQKYKKQFEMTSQT